MDKTLIKIDIYQDNFMQLASDGYAVVHRSPCF